MEPYERLDEELAYEGDRTIMRRRFRSADGAEHAYDITLHPGGAVVFALTEEGDVVLTRQFRPGPEREMTSVDCAYMALDALGLLS